MKFCILVAYVVMMVVVIALTARKNLSLNEFLLGGRKVGPWLSALSYGASYFSAVIIVGYAGSTGWQTGISAVWCGIGGKLAGLGASGKAHAFDGGASPGFHDPQLFRKAL
ncbi:MAG: hypothetical protein RSG96_06800 [Clostridia bacterium]